MPSLRSLIACLLAMLAVVGHSTAQGGVCATCSAIPSLGAPVNDACTLVVVAFQRHDSGTCTLNPAPSCVPHVNCLFSFTVSVTDRGCGVLYWSRHCTQLVDSWGNPVGLESCGGPTWFPNPTVVTNYPVSCGKRESIKFERIAAGNSQVIAQPSGSCTACPAQSDNGGD